MAALDASQQKGGEGGFANAVGQLAAQAPAATAPLTCPCLQSSQHAALRCTVLTCVMLQCSILSG